MDALTRRQLLAGVSGIALMSTPEIAEARFGSLFMGHGGAGASSGVLATQGFTNDSSSAVAANTPSQVFGLVFRIGDIPAGVAPIIKVNGVTQNYSHGLQRFWPDGSLQRVTVILAASTMPGVAGSRTATVTISGGGTWPAQGSGTAGLNRSLSEVYNQQITVNGKTPVAPYVASSNLNARTADVASWLWPSSDPNIYLITKWLDGPAGTAWKISTNMAATHGGSADGQLLCDHYVIALNDASNALGGFRWLGIMRAPFYKAVVTSKAYFWFQPPSVGSPSSGLNWSIQPGGGGSPTYTPHSMASVLQPTTFTWDTSGNMTFPSDPGWYSGGGGSDNGLNWVPVIVTGSIPTTSTSAQCVQSSLAAGGLVWAQVSGAARTTGTLNSGSVSGPQYGFTNTGSGGTLTPVPGFCGSTCLPFATAGGTYNFFQGSGSIATDSTLRATIDQTYWQSWGGSLPANITSYQGVAKGGNVADLAYPYSWNPYNAAFNRTNGVNQGGPPEELGPLPGSALCEFYNQTAVGLKVARINGFVCAGQAFDIKDNAGGAYDRPINLANPANSYTNLPASTATTTQLNVGFGYTAAAGVSNQATDAGDPSHEPDFTYWAFLRTGELQFLDFMVNQATAQNACMPIPSRNWTIGATNYYGVFGAPVDGARGRGWGTRNITRTAFMYPWDPSNNSLNTPYLYSDGSQLGKYLQDISDVCCQYTYDFLANANSTTYGSTAAANYAMLRGLWYCVSYITGTTPEYTFQIWEIWQFSYICLGMMYGALRGNAAAVGWITKFVNLVYYIGNNQPWIGNTGSRAGYYFLQSIATQSVISLAPIAGSGAAENYGAPIVQDEQFGSTLGTWLPSPTVSWTPTGGVGNAFQLSGVVWKGTATLTMGSPNATVVSETFNAGFLAAGMVLSGTGIPTSPSTTVSGTGSGTFTMSANATAGGTVSIVGYQVPSFFTVGFGVQAWVPATGDIVFYQSYDGLGPISLPSEISGNATPYIMRDVTTLANRLITFNLTASGTPQSPGPAISISSPAGMIIGTNGFPISTESPGGGPGLIMLNPIVNLLGGNDYVSQGRWSIAWAAALAANAKLNAVLGFPGGTVTGGNDYCQWLANCSNYSEYANTGSYDGGPGSNPSYLIQPTLA